MFTLKHFISGSLFLFVLAGTALAQENRAPIETPREPVAAVPAGPLVTAAATAKRVRFVSPGTVVQLRLEVYNEAGQKLFDTELRGGNVLDWPLQDGAGERVQVGSYACVLTTKSLSGRLSQRVGLVTVNDEKAAVEAAGAAQLSLAQQQIIGPVEDNAAFTILQESEAEAITAVTHDGTDGQLTSTTGALTFRTGDLFSGKDMERVRITAEGDVGIGTGKPQAKLDVAGDVRASGTIRASKGVEFADGTLQTSGLSGRKDKDGNIIPNAAGTGTTNQVAKWTETGGAGTLGDSTITEVSGRVGIGVPNPTYKLVVGPDIGPGLTTSDLTISRGPGQSVSIFAGASGANGMNFGWDQANQRAFVNAPVQSPITFTHGGVSERMRIATSGNVGIGTNNPGTKLDVAGDINTATQYNIGGARVLSIGPANLFVGVGAGNINADIKSTFVGTDAGSNNTAGFNSFFGANAGRKFGVDAAGGEGNSYFGESAGMVTTGNSNNTYIGRETSGVNNLTNATTLGYRARVTQSDSLVLGTSAFFDSDTGESAGDTNVGIGTTAPSERLEVVGNVKASGSLTVDTNTLHVDAANNRVGIGTTSPNAELGVVGAAGNADFFMRAAGATKGINFGVDGSTPNPTLFIAHYDGVNPAINRLIINPEGTVSVPTRAAATITHLCILGNIIADCSSSLRYKERVAPLSAGLDLLSRLRPVSFKWKGREERDLGLIAEEVERVEPLLVTRNSAGEIQGVKYDQLSVVLINAVREQQAQIERQQSQIGEQRMQLQQKHLRTEQLEVRLAALEVVIKQIGPGFNKRGEARNRRHAAGLRSRAKGSGTTRR